MTATLEYTKWHILLNLSLSFKYKKKKQAHKFYSIII